ncbi:MAG: SemiSWEET transporter [Leptospiraceae bacterium]|nr:SemiSWEET transporter [Leptospiraceae bacterium]MDW8305493.1 SemiSWEET transporter [Leptospiraceae bacterium]
MDEVAAFLGYLAGTLTTISFFPQLLKVIKLKSAKDISYRMFVLFILGVLLWFIYGILTNAWPVILTNLITFIVASSILVLKIRYDREDSK